MLENVKEGDLAIFKNGEERKIIFADKRELEVYLIFNAPISSRMKDGKGSICWAYRYNSEWDGETRDRNDIIKVIHMEEG